nr:transposase [Thermoflavimicrobium dichotomicum]
MAAHERLDRSEIQKRLLLCLYGLGTNMGLKRMATGDTDVTYDNLLYIKRKFIHPENLKAANIRVDLSKKEHKKRKKSPTATR